MKATSPDQEIARLWSRGEAASSAKRWREAADAYAAIIARNPGHLPALLKSSGALLRVDSYRAARDSLLSAFKLANNHPGLVMELGRKLRTFHEADLLLQLVRNSGFVRCGDPRMLTEMALIVSSVGDQELALQLVTEAVNRDPRGAQPRYLRGTVLMFLGRMEEAEQELEASIRLLPTFAQSHWVLSRLRKWTDQENHIERLTRLIGQTQEATEAEAYLSFALHNELHDLKRYEESWRMLERGCRAKRAIDPYDEVKGRQLFSAVKALCTAEFVQSTPRQDEYSSIFIVGMHRSGTTLLERILGGHSLVSDGGETYAFTAQLKIASDHKIQHALDIEAVQHLPGADFDAIGRGFVEGSRWRAKGKPFLTEKLPPNFVNAGFIAKALPSAKILHMVRDPVDTCFSNLRTYFSNAALYSFDQVSLANHFGEYRDLMRHWREVMPSRLLDISYDGLVTDTPGTTRRIFDFCGLPFEEDALRVERSSGAVSTASSAHVRQGILTNRGAAWKPYEVYLQPLLDRLTALGLI
ncbi:sulfotransferase [Lysobacter yangpyeongensis]|uniref:Sulfotransferase n=1 Tax=Lysobacter yangpyeongensis TaxID=346182 RepID=A0ABW0SLM6_9GAMM